METFTDLEAWKTGLALAREIQTLAKKFPKEELYGITQQIKRASKSILANMSEGFGKYTFADKAHKFVIARGESAEVKALLIVALTLDFAKDEEIKPLIQKSEQVGRLLSGLITAMRKLAKTNR